MSAPDASREPWWHARSGALVALAIALAGGWVNDKVGTTRTATLAEAVPKFRDREVDALTARVAALEARCK